MTGNGLLDFFDNPLPSENSFFDLIRFIFFMTFSLIVFMVIFLGTMVGFALVLYGIYILIEKMVHMGRAGSASSKLGDRRCENRECPCVCYRDRVEKENL